MQMAAGVIGIFVFMAHKVRLVCFFFIMNPATLMWMLHALMHFSSQSNC